VLDKAGRRKDDIRVREIDGTSSPGPGAAGARGVHETLQSVYIANEALFGVTTISRCKNLGVPDVNNPKLAIRNEQSKKARQSEIVGGDNSSLLICRSVFPPI
jgi:hypothetical protein